MSILKDTTAAEVDAPVQFDRAAAIASLRAKVETAITHELEKFRPETIVESIATQLRKAEREVTWKILGLDNKWSGKWEIDHCNGRISPLSQELADRCQPMLTDAVAEIAREVVAEMTVDAKARETLKKAFKTELQSKLDRMVRDTANTTALNIACELVDGVVKEVRAEAGL